MGGMGFNEPSRRRRGRRRRVASCVLGETDDERSGGRLVVSSLRKLQRGSIPWSLSLLWKAFARFGPLLMTFDRLLMSLMSGSTLCPPTLLPPRTPFHTA